MLHQVLLLYFIERAMTPRWVYSVIAVMNWYSEAMARSSVTLVGDGLEAADTGRFVPPCYRTFRRFASMLITIGTNVHTCQIKALTPCVRIFTIGLYLRHRT